MGRPSKQAPLDHRLGPCVGCVFGEIGPSPIFWILDTTQESPDFFHTDLMGPFPTPSLNGSKFVQVFVQSTDRNGDKQRFPTVFFLKQKSETLIKCQDDEQSPQEPDWSLNWPHSL